MFVVLLAETVLIMVDSGYLHPAQVPMAIANILRLHRLHHHQHVADPLVVDSLLTAARKQALILEAVTVLTCVIVVDNL
jgi:hypothetical protein